jgi:hypothetical protein
MATWQFDMDLLPRKQLLALFGEVPSILKEDMLDAATTWGDQLLPPDCANRISKLLPEGQSWSPAIRMWGEEDGNRISLFHDEAGHPNAISVRIDVRDPNKQFFEGIVEFANSLDAVFLVMEDFQIFEPGVEALVRLINQSSAGRFVKDPHEFLERLRTGRRKIRDLH